jgi:uncharacterized protein YciI
VSAEAPRPAPPVRLVVLHDPGPLWQAGRPVFEQPGVQAHIAHWRSALADGRLGLGGPFLDERGGGMMVSAAGVDAEQFARFAAEDPAVRTGLLMCTVRPWMIGMDALSP